MVAPARRGVSATPFPRIGPLPARSSRRYGALGAFALGAVFLLLLSALPSAGASSVITFNAPYSGRAVVHTVNNQSVGCGAHVSVGRRPTASLLHGTISVAVNASLAPCPNTLRASAVNEGRLGFQWLNFTVPSTRSGGYNASALWSTGAWVGVSAVPGSSNKFNLSAFVEVSLHLRVYDLTTKKIVGTSYNLILYTKSVHGKTVIAPNVLGKTVTVGGTHLPLLAGHKYELESYLVYLVEVDGSTGRTVPKGAGAWASVVIGDPVGKHSAEMRSATVS